MKSTLKSCVSTLCTYAHIHQLTDLYHFRSIALKEDAFWKRRRQRNLDTHTWKDDDLLDFRSSSFICYKLQKQCIYCKNTVVLKGYKTGRDQRSDCSLSQESYPSQRLRDAGANLPPLSHEVSFVPLHRPSLSSVLQ